MTLSARVGGVGVPLGGMAVAFTALLLWVSGLQLTWLDALVLAMFALGLGLSLVAYLRGRDLVVRRLGVVGIGCNGFGVVMLAILYAAG
jgi:hypothetical protein